MCVTTSTECRDDIIVEQALKFNALVARGPNKMFCAVLQRQLRVLARKQLLELLAIAR